MDANGNQIVSETSNGSGIERTIKYGLIRLLSEKSERRISFKTLLQITEAKEKGFAGSINIAELNMSVVASQIVMMRSETEVCKVLETFTNLATANVVLEKVGDKFEIVNEPPVYFRRQCLAHYEATVHYAMQNGERHYLLDFDKIKNLVQIEYEDGYEIIVRTWSYGH